MKPVKIFNNVNRFTIDWTLNALCTYKCSYCHPTLYAGNNYLYNKRDDPYIVKEFLKKLKSDLSNRSVHIFINGGEPTISPSIETILDFCNDNNWAAYINTNGSRSMEWWKEYAHKAFKITISYHPESLDEEIFDKVAFINTQTNVGVFTLMYPPLWQKAYDAYYKFAAMKITLATSRVFKRDLLKFDESYEYTQEQLDWMNNNPVKFSPMVKRYPNGNHWGETLIEYRDEYSIDHVFEYDEVEFVNSRKNKFVGWKCNMGVDHLFIDQEGSIWTSTCKQREMLVSDIKSYNGFKQSPYICKTEWCMCTLDTIIPKQLIK